MSREQVVRKLSGEELQIRVAGILGAEDIDRGSRTGALMGYWPEDDEGRGEGWKPIEDYPNVIAAAWPLAERAGLSVLRVDNEWWCGIFNGTNGDWWFEGEPMCDKSATRAIVWAFILIMEGDGV